MVGRICERGIGFEPGVSEGVLYIGNESGELTETAEVTGVGSGYNMKYENMKTQTHTHTHTHPHTTV